MQQMTLRDGKSVDEIHVEPFQNLAIYYNMWLEMTKTQMKTEQIDRGKSDTLHLLHQFRQLGAEARGLGFVPMHDGVFKQRIQPLDFLNRFVSLWHRHLYNLLVE